MKGGLAKLRNILLHIVVLSVVFVVSVLLFSRSVNTHTPDTADTMEKSTFPLVYMMRGGVSFNCLHGYAQEMDVSDLRENITPLTSDHEIDIAIQSFSAAVDSVSYKVMDLSGEETLENTQVVKLENESDLLKATLSIQGRIRMNQEYALQLEVVSGGRRIYYYTRILLADGLHTDEYLNYVSGFYDKTVNRADLGSIGQAVEPDETTDEEKTLAYADIHDSVEQLTWAGLKPQLYYKPTPQIREINTSTASLTLDYRIAAMNAEGETEVYNVSEFYRVRFTDSRVFLLNFERTTDEVFDPENQVMEQTGIRLGITGKEIQYQADARGRVVAFVQENALWTYERSTSKLTQVFSFPQKENMDARDFYKASAIRIMKVEENADVWFAVAGYMNRGSHEGENGLVLYRYAADTDMVEEIVFLSSQSSYDQLIRDAQTLCYLTEDETVCYALMQERLFKINILNRTYEFAGENIQTGCSVGSGNGRFFAYQTGGEYDSQAICLMDLETGNRIDIPAGSGERIRVICFMGEDLVYGLARDEDLKLGDLENGYFPMYRLEIVDGMGRGQKTYEQPGVFVTGTERSRHMLTLRRASVGEGGRLSPVSEDQIMSTQEDLGGIGTATQYSNRKQTQVYLRVGGTVSDRSPEVIYSKIIRHAASHTVAIPVNKEMAGRYRVYAHGKLYAQFTRLNEAIACANREVGVVVDRQMDYLWVRGDRKVKADIALEKLPAGMAAGISTAEEARAAFGERAEDLTGCSLEEVLFFVSRGIPVAAVTANGPVTIVGYDEYNTHLLDPNGEEWYYYGINDSTQMFEEAGNRFFICRPEA
ncbi:MAG: hypothetical protein Q4B59_01025 [Lachnospiraceae bacterium]|nr:hypothetical protein [Lachnospiraceae bacterium]